MHTGNKEVKIISLMNRFSNCDSFPDKEIKESRAPVLKNEWSVGDHVEVLSQDSGLRGCWFRSKILDLSKRGLKVQYCDLDDSEAPSGKLEEEPINANRLANPDVDLGMRFNGRLRVRPWPCQEISDVKFKVGDAVDVWRCDGWWEGVVIGYSTSGGSTLLIYFPGEKNLDIIERKNLRVSRDWVDKKWMDIKPFPNILSYLKESKLLLPQALVEAYSSAVATDNVCNLLMLKESENANQNVPCASKSAGSKPEKKCVSPVLVEAHSSAVATDKVCNSPMLKESEGANQNVQCASKSPGSKPEKNCSQTKGRVPPVLIEAHNSAVATDKVCNSLKLGESEDANQNVPCASKFAGSKAVKKRSQRRGRKPPVMVEAHNSAVATDKVCNSPTLNESEDPNQNVPCAFKSAGPKAVKKRSQRKRCVSKDKQDGICSNSGNAGCDGTTKRNIIRDGSVILALEVPKNSKYFTTRL